MADRWDRLATLTGAGAGLLWVLGIIVREGATDNPMRDTDPQRIFEWFNADTGGILVSALIFFAAALLFFWFMGSLRIAAVAAEGSAGRLTSLIFGSGLLTTAFIFALAAPDMSGAIAAANDRLTPETAHALWTMGDGFFLAAGVTLAALFLAASLLSLRRAFLPRWLAWTQIVMGVALLLPWIGWAVLVFLFPVWLVVVSVLLYQRTAPTARIDTPGKASP